MVGGAGPRASPWTRPSGSDYTRLSAEGQEWRSRGGTSRLLLPLSVDPSRWVFMEASAVENEDLLGGLCSPD